MGSNDGKSKESDHRLDIPDEPEGSLIDLGSDLNPDIDCILVLEKGFSELSNMTQESLDIENGKNTQGGNSSVDYSASLEGQSNERGPVLRQLATWLLQLQ